MFRSLFSRKPALTGAPPAPRVKSYSAQSGYVYQYYYLGRRPLRREPGTEFVFSVSADRKNWREVSVVSDEAAIDSWQAAHGREFSSAERYAVAKMALFQAFDERPTPALMKEAIRVRRADIETIAETLGL